MVGFHKEGTVETGPLVKVRNFLVAIALPVILIALWQYASTNGIVRPTLFPAPTTLAGTFVDLVSSGILLESLAVSFRRVITGFLIGTLAGLVVGFVVGLFPLADRALSVFTSVLRPIPVIALIPVFIVIFGIGETTNVAVITVGSFWSTMLNTTSGIRECDDKLLELAYAYRISSVRTVFQIILPAAVASIITGVRLGLGMAWMGVVAAEMIGASSGVGYMIMYARELAQTDRLYVYVLLIGVIGLVLDRILLVVQNKLTRKFKGQAD